MNASAVEPPDARLLRSFLVVAEELHFGRAARRLHLSQPPLSMQIRRLEEQVGARLFDRDRRHVALTDAGSALVGRARHLLAELDRAYLEARRIARGELGTLAVGYTATATYDVLPPLVPAFRKACPDVRLELIDMRSTEQPAALRAGRIEVGLACGPLDEPDLVERVLHRDHLVVALPATHPLAARRTLRVRDLEGQPWVLPRPDVEPIWAGASTRALARAGVTIEVAQETDTKIALLGLIAANVGLSVVSSSMRRLGRDGVVFRELVDLPLRLPLVALSLREPSPRAAKWLSLARTVR